MIGRIAGVLLEKNPPYLLVDCGGVGYEIAVPMSTFYNLPNSGEKIVLLTQLIVREDAHLLYGFGTQQERTTFRELLKISGIGARMALAVLSGMSVQELAQAVTMQDAARLTRTPGIGHGSRHRGRPGSRERYPERFAGIGLLRKRGAHGGKECSCRDRRFRRHQAGPEGAVQELVRQVSHAVDPANSRPIG
jgi:hypothetical protein